MDNKERISDVLLILARTWLYMTVGALMLYFIVAAIERSRVTVTISRSYRVPIETQESEDE